MTFAFSWPGAGAGTGSRLFLGLAVASALWSVSCQPPAPAEGLTEEAEGRPTGRVINVETRRIVLEDFVEDIRLTAVSQADRDAMVSAEEPGRVVEIFVDRGMRVSAGDALVKVDDAVLAAQVAQAEASRNLAEATWERRRRLFEEDSVGSEIAYLDARYGVEQAVAQYRSLAARLERTTVRAPFGGVIDDRMIELGETVGVGQPIVRLLDLNPIKILAGVPERYSLDVRLRDEATVTFDVLEGESFSATVDHVGATVDPENRTLRVEMSILNRSERIKPQMVADVSLTRRRVDAAIVVPQDAVVRWEEGYIVYVVEGTGNEAMARSQSVELGAARRNVVVIESGLSVGDHLIVVGQRSVADGDPVRVVEER